MAIGCNDERHSCLQCLKPCCADCAPTQVTDAEFNWDEGSEKPTLRDISFECPPGSLTMVVGNVGCGKSSVLAGLIGQIERCKGSVAVGGKVAYVAQTAWIINDIVQVRGRALLSCVGGGTWHWLLSARIVAELFLLVGVLQIASC